MTLRLITTAPRLSLRLLKIIETTTINATEVANTQPIRSRNGIPGIAHFMAADNGILRRAKINAALAVDFFQNKDKYKNGPNSWADES